MHIGFIGLGLMGTPMVKRLLGAGFNVTLWNRTADKCDALKEQGAQVAATMADLTLSCDTIMLCLSDTIAVEQVVFGQNGLAQTLTAGQTLIDFSSIDPNATAKFASKLKDTTGTNWVDAPVSGGTKGAEAGTLIIMAGGETDVLARIMPALKPLSQKVTHMGPSGSGQTTKICNQMIVASNALVIAETIALARKSGVDISMLSEALVGGFADSIPLQILAPQMAAHDFTLKWKVRTLAKDLAAAEQLAALHHAQTPVTATARNQLRAHGEKGNSDRDLSTIIELYESTTA